MPLQGNLSIERMCQLTQVSRAGFYRYLDYRAPEEEDMTMRSAIQEIALEHDRYYGYRRVTAELRRRGMMVNHKRVARIMTTDNLLTIQNRKLRQVTDRDQELENYLNLASRMNVRGPNQLWIADITYIRLKAEFVYLAVVLDAFSRKVVGWSLDRSLQARLPTSALERAIMSRQPPPGLVHHSDQGVQYRCAGYLQVLRDHRMVASISRPGYPKQLVYNAKLLRASARSVSLRVAIFPTASLHFREPSLRQNFAPMSLSSLSLPAAVLPCTVPAQLGTEPSHN
jgi:putative transposase